MSKLTTLSIVAIITTCLVNAGCGKGQQQNSSSQQQPKGVNSMSQRIKTDSGLEYIVLQEGSGATPQVGQMITAHYTGWLNANGEPGIKFDSSVDRGEPLSFKIGIGYVIPGWDEGLISMKIGEKRRLFIPADLGYGSRGAGRIIPPNASLIFDVELISVGK